MIGPADYALLASTGQLAACLNVSDGGVVIDRFRIDGLQQGDVIDDASGMREEFTHPGAVLAMLIELEGRGRDGETCLA